MRPKIFRPQVHSAAATLVRFASASSSSTHQAVLQPSASLMDKKKVEEKKLPPLAVMPTKTLVRSLLFTSVMASPLLLKSSLSALKFVVESKSPLFSPSKNPLMNYLLRTTIYNHFCAGANEAQVRGTVRHMKDLGFKGVILGYARESVVSLDDPGVQEKPPTCQQAVLDYAIEEWKQGNLRTLGMIGKGDFLGIKFTGAGPAALEALARGDAQPPPKMLQAITEICEAIAAQESRLWIDAEQQVFQPTIDAWTIDLMRRFNRDGKTVVYNTIQAYLKASVENVHRHLTLAAAEGWTLGIKLVRGAYIAHDHRSRIHDTKADTDRSYNHIVESILTRQFPLDTGRSQLKFPDTRLFVASHNADSVRKAYSLSRYRLQNGLPTVPVEVGQLQGMADEISCGLIAENLQASTTADHLPENPGVFKCLAWGSIEECLHFLLRRAVENQSAMGRTHETLKALKREAWRRVGWS
ncbi:proline oxidase Put1 [Aspergillus campestris IBT 28561]|uniref:Proline dehydrogenase n=1 Tax=Aspergillus campestris (strain IBT 28561) TaxID=1392248 RepID=A0A2I1CWN9_ASPC2|nr:proline oxidase Put1 [Aspergillus campestris IBT 28561]PKY02030.1 proline oxidase Put1 [Aspergillus campestris IBT 28561]